MGLRPLLKDIHVEAYAILESLKDVHFVTKPQPHAGAPLQTAWHGYKAKQNAYRSLHERDRVKAYAYLNISRVYLDKFNQGSHNA